MTRKESEELTKTEPVRGLTPFEEAERWFEAAFRRPFALFGHRLLPRLRAMEMEELSPSMDIFEEGDNVVVKAELPGMKKEDIEVSVTDHRMRISGEKSVRRRSRKRITTGKNVHTDHSREASNSRPRYRLTRLKQNLKTGYSK